MSSREPRVVAVVVEYKSGPQLDRCLESIMNQSVKFSQIVVVNNYVEAPVETSHPENILVINTSQNLGFGAAVNAAVTLEASGSDYVATFNPDVILDPKWLETCLSVALSSPQAASFATDMTRMDGRIWDGRGDRLYPGVLARRKSHARRVKLDSNAQKVEEEIVDSVCAAAAIYRTKDFVRLSGFWEELFLYLEDVELGLRLRKAGLTNVQIHAPLAKHVGAGTTGGRCGAAPIFYSERNRTLLLFGSYTGIQFFIGILTKPFGDLILLARAMSCRRLRSYLSGVIAGWSDIAIAIDRRSRNRELLSSVRKNMGGGKREEVPKSSNNTHTL